MDELVAARIVSLAFAEPGRPGRHHRSFPRKPTPRRAAPILRRRPRARPDGDTSQLAGASPRARAPSCAPRDRGDVYRAAGPSAPAAMAVAWLPAERGADHRPRAMDQQRSEISISALADPTDMFLAAARGDAWRQSEPGSEMARRLELGAVSDRSDESRRRQWPDARRGRETLARLAGLVPGEDRPSTCRPAPCRARDGRTGPRWLPRLVWE